jgi:hypothetical protein
VYIILTIGRCVDPQAGTRKTKHACSIKNSCIAFVLTGKVVSVKVVNFPCNHRLVGCKQVMHVGKHQDNTHEGACLLWSELSHNSITGKSWYLSIGNRLQDGNHEPLNACYGCLSRVQWIHHGAGVNKSTRGNNVICELHKSKRREVTTCNYELDPSGSLKNCIQKGFSPKERSCRSCHGHSDFERS